jgi:hypothetical protein
MGGELTRLIIEAASPHLREIGIELFDLRFKRINYVEEVRKKYTNNHYQERGTLYAFQEDIHICSLMPDRWIFGLF